MYASRLRRKTLWGTMLCVVAAGCTPDSKPQPSDSAPRGEAPTPRSVAASPSDGSSNGTTATPTKQPPEDAPMSLENAGLRALIPATADVAKELVTALAEGNVSAAEKLFLRNEQLGKVLTEGHRAILGGHLVLKNEKNLETLSQVLQGKSPKHTFEPGAISWSPSNAFQAGIPVMSKATAGIEVDGISMRLELELVHLEKRWLIFRLSDARE